MIEFKVINWDINSDRLIHYDVMPYIYSEFEKYRKRKKLAIKDVTFDESYYLKLSKEQVRLLEWLAEKEMLPDIRIEIFEGYDFKEI